MSCDVSNITFVVDRSICGHVDSMFSLGLRILLVPRSSQCYRIRLLSTSSPAYSGHNKVRVINTTKKTYLNLALVLAALCLSLVVENPAKERDQ